MVKLYLKICPTIDLNWRCSPRAGGYMEQDWDVMQAFELIEQRIVEISNRKKVK